MRAAVLGPAGALSWEDLDLRSERAAAAFASEARRGARAAICADPSPDYVTLLVGALKAGMSVVPISTMATTDVRARLLADCRADFLFAEQDRLRGIETPAGCRRVELDAPGRLEAWWLGARADSLRPPPGPGEEFNIIYSSGTTGQPKGIVHDHALRATQVQGLQAFGFGPESVTAITTPLYTNYALVALFATLAAGGAVRLSARFREAELLSACRDDGLTHAFLVPAQIERLLRHPGFDRAVAGRPMTVVSAGSALPVALKREMIARWPGLLIEIYGATEGGASTALVAQQFPDKLASVGRPGADCDIRIVSDAGREVPVGETGEVVGRSGTMMRGYLNRAADTDALLWRAENGDRYLRSGDVGHLDGDGFLYITDRKKDVIISGGLNIFASDLEEVLRAHPQVDDCAVVAAPSARWGETPVAFVVPRSEPPPADELAAWANGRLARHQRLHRVMYRQSLPRNDMGKVLKRDLRGDAADLA